MYNRIPIEDACCSEVLARVAFRIVQLDYLRRRWPNTSPNDAFFRIGRELDEAGFGALAMYVYSSRVMTCEGP